MVAPVFLNATEREEVEEVIRRMRDVYEAELEEVDDQVSDLLAWITDVEVE